jgi:hypothetical protein
VGTVIETINRELGIAHIIEQIVKFAFEPHVVPRLRLPGCWIVVRLLAFEEYFQSARTHGVQHGFVVALGLVGIGEGEVGDGIVEDIAFAHVTVDLGGFPGASVGTGQHPTAGFRYWRMTLGKNTSTIGLIFMSLSWRM